RRDAQASYLKWIAPDNGGSDITSYKIYRSTTGVPGSEVQIGHQIGTKTSFNDRSVDAAASSYSYRVVGVNAQGDGFASNSIDLVVTPRIDLTGACSAPGVELLTDPVGDGTDANPQHDITSVSIAEPLDNATSGAASKIYFTIKVGNLSAPIEPGWRWSVRFNVPGFYPPGHPINVTLASVRATAPSDIPGTGGTNETIPDTTGSAAYALRTDNLCLPNTAPMARLSASPDKGAMPLSVTLSGSGSTDPDSI